MEKTLHVYEFVSFQCWDAADRYLQSDRSDAGDTVGTEWIFACLCPTELGFKSQSNDSSVLPLLPISSAIKAKNPRNTEKRSGRSPVVQLNCSSPLSHLTGCGMVTPEPAQAWRLSHPRWHTGMCAQGWHGDPDLGLRQTSTTTLRQLSGKWERHKWSPVLG